LTINFYNDVSASDISIGIFDLNGRKVFMNHAGKLPAGNINIKMNLNKKSPGKGDFYSTVINYAFAVASFFFIHASDL